MQLRRRTAALAIAAVLPFVLTGCGDDTEPAGTTDDMTDEMTEDDMTDEMTDDMTDEMTDG